MLNCRVLIFLRRDCGSYGRLSWVRWNDLQVNSFCCVVLSLLFFPMVFAAE